MKKIIAIAALIVTAYAAPTVSVQAASAYPSKCLVLPLLQSECRDMMKSDMHKATGSMTMSSKKMASTTMSAAKPMKMPVPMWWNCTRAEGAKYMFSCK